MTVAAVRERRAARSVQRPRAWLRGRARRERDEELQLEGLRRLDDVRCVLERARSTVSAGWVQDCWVAATVGSGPTCRKPA